MKLKKILAQVLAVTIVLSSMATVAFAEGDSGATVEVSTYEELVAALENDNANIIMKNNITATATQGSGYGMAGIVLNTGDVLDGNGYKLTINDANKTWDCAVAVKGGTVKNLTIAGAMRGIFMPGANGDVVIENCKFEDVIYTFNSDAGSKDYSVTIKNTILNGWTSYSNVHGSVAFEDCTFGEGNGYAFCRPYQPTTFTGCEFNEGFELDTSKTADSTLEFNDCTYAGEELSAETAVSMFYKGGAVVVDNETVEFAVPVAQIDNIKYATLQKAFDSAEKGDTIELLSDVTVTESIAVEGEVVFDLNGKTMSGSILAPNATLTIKNGTIVNTDSSVSAIEINAGELTLTDINIDSARHAVRIDGEVTATINSGTYKITAVTAGITQHAVNVSNGANVTINGGTFTGPKGTDADSGSAVNTQANSIVTINGGTYSGGKNNTLSAKGTLVVCGGTFDQNPSEYIADGLMVSKNADGTYGVGNLPNAEVKNLEAITIDEYSIYTGSLTEGGDPIDLQVAMEFIAKDTPEEAAQNAFGQYTTDFFITIDGIEGDSFVADGCYLAGNYGTFGWIMIPLDGMEIIEGKVYPVITSVGFDFKYKDICTSVKDFKCGIYFSDEVIEANPDMQVTLTLGLSESIEAAQDAEFITVDQPYTYKAKDFGKTETVWTTATDAGYYTKDGKTLGLMRFLFMVESDGMNGFGIDYLKADKETVAKSVQNSTIVSGESTIIFYGDICDFEESDVKQDEYSARGFAIIGEDYDYSEIISCTPDWTKALIYGGNN